MRKLSLTAVMAVVLAVTLNPSAPVTASPADDYSGTHFGAGNLPPGCENDVLVGDLTLTPLPDQVLDPKAANNVCHHMRTDMNGLDSPQVDVLVLLPVTPAVERDMRIMRQAVDMWEGGIDYLAPQMGLKWMADGVDFHVTVDYFDPTGDGGGEFTTEPVVDPEIVVIGATNPFGGAGIGIDPIANLFVDPDGPLPCLPVDNPFDIEQWEALPGFNDHHEERSGTYNEDCGDTDGGQSGGNVCFAVNTALDPVPDAIELVSLFDLVAHEFGHCMTVGHVGDGAEGLWGATPTNDIMAYDSDPPSINKCVSTLDVEGLATVMSRYLDVDGDGVAGNEPPLLANDQVGEGGSPFQVQHPSDHLYASGTGSPLDCPQPDLGLVPGQPTDWTPTPVESGSSTPTCGPTDAQVTDAEGDATGLFLLERGATPTSEDSLDITSGYLTWDAATSEVSMHIKVKNLEAEPTSGAPGGEYFRFTFEAAGEGWQATAKREPGLGTSFALSQLNDLGTSYQAVATLKGSFDADTDEVVIRVPAMPYNVGDSVPAWTESMPVTSLEIIAQRNLVRATSTTDIGRGLCDYSVGQEGWNRAPVAEEDFAATTRHASVRVPVLANDTDPDGDRLQISTVTSPSRGTAAVNADGTITYTPRRGFSGLDHFTYVADDMRGGTDEATVTIKVSKR